MIDEDPSTEGKRIVHSPDSTIGGKFPANRSRRRLLQMLTSGGGLLLAGCGQDSASDGSITTGTGTKRGDTSTRMLGQTFRAPVEQNPGRISFHGHFASIALEETSAFDATTKEQVSGRLLSIIREPGVWNDERFVGGDTHYTWLEDTTITPTDVTVTINDEASWSDGHPITGTDIAVGLMDSYIRNPFPPYFATKEKETPTIPRGAIDKFDVRERAVTYQSSPGYFKQFWNSTLRGFGTGYDVVPTHIEPYGRYAEAVFETARRAQQGKIDPWKGWDDPRVRPDDLHKATLVEKYLAKEGKYVAKFSKPEHVVSNSAWDLVEINGPEAVFEPNPHHRNADKIDFERMVLEYTDSEDRMRAALTADRLDYAAPGPTAQTVVEALPDHITELQIPGGPGSGNELGLNFNHSGIGNRKVRLALMYALDQPTIANNVHQSAALPVTTPGGESWDATEYVSTDWIDENLTTYPQDRNKAASLMRGAGYTRDGDRWFDADGAAFSLSLPTKSETPRWEYTVASQLSEFGIPTSVQPLEKTLFRERVHDGKFPMWAASGTVTSTTTQALLFWYSVPIHPEVYGIYPEEQFQKGNFDVSAGGAPVPRTEERYSVFTLKAPPIGQPKGSLQEYHPSSLSLFWLTNPPEAELRHRVKTAMWLANWLLPTIPINKTREQHFIDGAHWQWPTDTSAWQAFVGGGPKSFDEIIASGTIRANPDNPEQA